MSYDPGLGIIQDEANRESKRAEIEMEKSALQELHHPSPPEPNVTQANIAYYVSSIISSILGIKTFFFLIISFAVLGFIFLR